MQLRTSTNLPKGPNGYEVVQLLTEAEVDCAAQDPVLAVLDRETTAKDWAALDAWSQKQARPPNASREPLVRFRGNVYRLCEVPVRGAFKGAKGLSIRETAGPFKASGNSVAAVERVPK